MLNYSPQLNELPLPPPGRLGWPWTEGSLQLPSRMPDGKSWPKVSIVTPSFNQGRFIEETIRSVLLQGYPNLEYIIMDGGSKDESVDIIKKYEKWITIWKSEGDSGQANAINKGFNCANGEIFAWLNSDDLLAPCAVYLAVSFFDNNKSVGMVTGDRINIDIESKVIDHRNIVKFFPWQLRYTCGVNQEASFWKKDIFYSCGAIDESLHYAMDYDLWFRLSHVTTIDNLPITMGIFRIHNQSKTFLVTSQKSEDEYIINLRKETSMVRTKYLGRESCIIVRYLLRRLHGVLKNFEIFFGNYRKKRNFIETKLDELKYLPEKQIQSLKKYIIY